MPCIYKLHTVVQYLSLREKDESDDDDKVVEFEENKSWFLGS